MFAREVMSAPVVTVTSDTHLKDAAALLLARGFTALPVVDRARLVGIVTEADLLPLEATPDPRSHLLPPAVPARPAARLVEQVMTRKVHTVPPDADVADVAQLMLARHLRAVPVVDGTRLVGIVTRRDLLAVLAHDDQAVRAAVAALLATALADPAGVHTDVADGVVTLSGRLAAGDRELAERLARTVPGVVEVRMTATG
jgi:CBS-domain-containing membrane protein